MLDVEKSLVWKIYPNPSNELVNFKSLSEGVKTIQILNLKGHIVGKLLDTNKISFRNFKTGFYSYKVTIRKIYRAANSNYRVIVRIRILNRLILEYHGEFESTIRAIIIGGKAK